jgi:hydrogenase-1 operon protein HyaF
MPLHEIPVRVEGDAGEPGGNAAAVLREVAGLLDALVRHGEGGSVDLKSLPLSPAEREWLKDRLGRGEVEITLDVAGGSTISETAYAGVWWVEHRDEQGVVGSEFIEVAYVPELVSAHPDDVQSGLDYLSAELADPK